MEHTVIHDAGRRIPRTAEEVWSMHVLNAGSPAGGRHGKAVVRRHVLHATYGNLYIEEFAFSIEEMRGMVPDEEIGPRP